MDFRRILICPFPSWSEWSLCSKQLVLMRYQAKVRIAFVLEYSYEYCTIFYTTYYYTTFLHLRKLCPSIQNGSKRKLAARISSDFCLHSFRLQFLDRKKAIEPAGRVYGAEFVLFIKHAGLYGINMGKMIFLFSSIKIENILGNSKNQWIFFASMFLLLGDILRSRLYFWIWWKRKRIRVNWLCDMD